MDANEFFEGSNGMIEMDASSNLQLRFLNRLENQLDQMHSIFDRGDWPQSSASRVELISILHVISGSAGTFGFPEIGVRASSLETMVESELVFTPELQEKIRTFIDFVRPICETSHA